MTTPSHPGFRASLSGASLFDLVQLECTRATHGCKRPLICCSTGDARMGSGPCNTNIPAKSFYKVRM